MSYNESVQEVSPIQVEGKPENISTTWNGHMCDACGVIATHTASKDGLELNFCGHHTRANAEKLTSNGFVISPEHYSFN